MPKPSQRRALGQERRVAKLQAIRDEVIRFLETLSPVIRRMVLHESVTIDEWRGYIFGPGEVRQQFKVAREQYERLIRRDSVAWRRYNRYVTPEAKLLREYARTRQIPRPGAPKKPAQDRADLPVAERVAQVKDHLREGFDLRSARKKAGGSASDDTRIQPLLEALGYSEAEVRAILDRRTLNSAAVFLVAEETGKAPKTIWSSLARARLTPRSK